jgi:hypothetical protein
MSRGLRVETRRASHRGDGIPTPASGRHSTSPQRRSFLDVSALIRADADVTVVNRAGQTPTEMAVRRDERALLCEARKSCTDRPLNVPSTWGTPAAGGSAEEERSASR